MNFSEFEMFISRSDNNIFPAIFLVFAWIATSDGSVDDAESKAIQNIVNVSEYEGDIGTLISIAERRDVVAIQIALEIIKIHVAGGPNAKLFLMMAIRVAVADGYLLPEENHILQLLADVLNLTKLEFRNIFREATGREFPCPPDLSNADFWRERDYANKHAPGSSKGRKSKTERCYAILGLDSGASQEDIKNAYRKLARTNHPDKFAALGKEAESVAAENFKRIKEAYDYLIHA